MDVRDALPHAHRATLGWTVSVINWPSTVASIVNFVRPVAVNFITLSVYFVGFSSQHDATIGMLWRIFLLREFRRKFWEKHQKLCLLTTFHNLEVYWHCAHAIYQYRAVDRRHVQHSIIMNVTWRRFDQSAKQLIVGHTTNVNNDAK